MRQVTQRSGGYEGRTPCGPALPYAGVARASAHPPPNPTAVESDIHPFEITSRLHYAEFSSSTLTSPTRGRLSRGQQLTAKGPNSLDRTLPQGFARHSIK